MCDKMAISAYILKIVKKDPFLRLQIRDKEMFNLYSVWAIESKVMAIFVKFLQVLPCPFAKYGHITWPQVSNFEIF